MGPVERAEQTVDTLEVDVANAKGALLFASAPIIGAALGVVIARVRLNKAHRALNAEREKNAHDAPCPHGDDVGCCLVCTPIVEAEPAGADESPAPELGGLEEVVSSVAQLAGNVAEVLFAEPPEPALLELTTVDVGHDDA